MGQTVVNVGSFDLTSHNGKTAYSTTRYFDIPANAGITSCVATFATHVSAGSFLDKAFSLNSVRAHLSTSWPTSGIALNAALLSTGQNAFRVTINSQAVSQWKIGDIYLTITYNDVGGGGTPPPNLGAVSINKTTLTAGDTITVSASACDAVFSRSIYLMLADNTVINNIAFNFGTAAGSWTVTVPPSLFATYASDSETLILKAYMEVYQTGTYVGSDAKNFTVYVPSAGSISVPSSITAGQTLSVPISAAGVGVSRRVGIYNSAGTLVDYLANVAGAESGTLTYLIPESWCATYAPNSNSFSLTIKMMPLIADTYVYGEMIKTVTVYVPASAVPTIGTFTATRNANGVNASITKYVQNYSKVNLLAGASGALGSGIVLYEIYGGGWYSATHNPTFGPFGQTGDITFTVKATDSRGRVGLKTVVINVEPYSAVSVNNLQAYRSNASKNPADEGTFATLIGKIIFSSIGGQNAGTIKGRVYEKGTAAPGWTTMADNTLVLFGGSLSVEKVYTAEISINDLITSYQYSIDIPTAKVTMGIAPNGDGVSFGTYPEAGKVKSVWPIVAPGLAPNPNLLHNWDFHWKQINQRGVGNGRSNWWVSFIDRWTRTAGYMTKEYDYIGVENGTTIRQVVESTMLAGMVVTVSIMKTDNTVIYGTGTVPSASGVTETIVISGFGTVTIAWAGSHIAFNFNSTTNLNIKKVKAELGTVSTLHLDPPIDEATNWMQCLRYYQNGVFLQGSFKAMWNGGSQIVGTINLLCPMRTIPTLVVHDYANLLTCYGIATWSPDYYEYTEVYNTSFVGVRFLGNVPAGALWGTRFYTPNFEMNAEI